MSRPKSHLAVLMNCVPGEFLAPTRELFDPGNQIAGQAIEEEGPGQFEPDARTRCLFGQGREDLDG